MLGAQCLWAGRDLYRATPAVTRDLGFSGLIRRTAPFNSLLRHAWGCRWPILTRIEAILYVNVVLCWNVNDFLSILLLWSEFSKNINEKKTQKTPILKTLKTTTKTHKARHHSSLYYWNTELPLSNIEFLDSQKFILFLKKVFIYLFYAVKTV
jgi:hypothetical protein